jgi:pimeloyl-ACP methyl ester carboxylesterase
MMQELARYWGSDYDWRACERKLNALPNFIPRSWAERAYPHNLIHYNKLDRGGHFAAWEQPQLFSEEIRASFKSLR